MSSGQPGFLFGTGMLAGWLAWKGVVGSVSFHRSDDSRYWLPFVVVVVVVVVVVLETGRRKGSAR